MRLPEQRQHAGGQHVFADRRRLQPLRGRQRQDGATFAPDLIAITEQDPAGQGQLRMAVLSGIDQLPAKHLDRIRRRLAESEARRPAHQHLGLARRAQGGETRQQQAILQQAVRQVLTGHFVEDRRRLRHQGCTALQVTAIIGHGRGDQGENVMADQIAPPAGIGIALVRHPCEAAPGGIGFEPGARHPEQGAPQGLAVEIAQHGHGGERMRAATAQQLQQHGLGLIVLMMRQGNDRGRGTAVGGIALGARHGLQTVAAAQRHLHMLDAQRHLIALAPRATVRHPGVGVAAQPVVHMDGGQMNMALPPGAPQQIQQHHGIESAGKSDFQRPMDGRGPAGQQAGQQIRLLLP